MTEFLGLDIGSSTIKGAVLDLDGLRVGKSVRVDCPEPLSGLPPGHFELDPEDILERVRRVLSQLLPETRNCAGLVGCNQMAGVLLADSSGRPLANYLSWRDQRVLEPHPSGEGTFYDVLKHRLADAGWEQLGNECKLGSSPSLLFWLSERKALPKEAIPLMLGDWISLQIGQAEAATEYTNALGALNLETLDWHHEAFEKLGLASLRWPRLTDPYRPVGVLALGGDSIPCYPFVGDHQSALAGMLLRPNELSINVSTGSQVSLLSSDWTVGDYQIRPYFDRQFLRTMTHLPAGRSLNVIVDLLKELATSQGVELENPWPYIIQRAEEAQTDLKAHLAFFAGPMGDSGSIENITVENFNVGSLFRAAFENMAQTYAICANRLSPDQNWNQVVLSGGLVQQSRLLKELILKPFACPSRIGLDAEATFYGLLLLALVCTRRANSLAEAATLLKSGELQ